MIDPGGLSVGDELPELGAPPISRLTLALYAGASGDHNPIHVDLDFARQSGLDDVLAHGMLAMAYMGRALTSSVPRQSIRALKARFVSPIPVHDRLTVRGVVTGHVEDRDEIFATVALSATNEAGIVRVTGEAWIGPV